MLGRKNDTKQGHFDWKIIGCLLHTFFDDLCKKAFPDILTLSLHERVFAAETYKCSLCEKTFKMKSVWQTHIAKRHFLIFLLWLCMKECIQVKPYKCSLCEVIFKMKSVWQTHIAKRHFLIFLLWLCMKECIQVKPYKCSLCEVIFKMKSVLHRAANTEIVYNCKKLQIIDRGSIMLVSQITVACLLWLHGTHWSLVFQFCLSIDWHLLTNISNGHVKVHFTTPRSCTT